MNNNNLSKTLIVSFSISIVCAIVISTAAVLLKPLQQANIEIDRQSNILAAAGLYDPELSVAEQFKKVTPVVVDLDSGKILDDVDYKTINPIKQAKILDGNYSKSFNELGVEDTAKIGRRENTSIVYLIKTNEQLSKLVIPIRGYGLWSTLYGFIALESNASTVSGLGFYQHGETPGLGGEVDNPDWKELWSGKELFKGNKLALQVVKGAVPSNDPNSKYKIDGLAGATLTSRGIHNLIQFWLGKAGFGQFLQRVKNGEM